MTVTSPSRMPAERERRCDPRVEWRPVPALHSVLDLALPTVPAVDERDAE